MDEATQSAAPNKDGRELAGATEAAVARVWSEILEIPSPDANDDFIELGGDSMTMVLTEFRIAEEFSVELPDGAMFTARTVRELAAMIDERLEHRGTGSAGPHDGAA